MKASVSFWFNVMCLAWGPVKNGSASLPSLPEIFRRGRGASTSSSSGMTSMTPCEGKCARLPPSGFSHLPPSSTGTMSVIRTCWAALPCTVIIHSAFPASTAFRPLRQGPPDEISSMIFRSAALPASSAPRTT
ncbi:hypothetical protein SBADM41S_09639 [Streptomyces badius]